MGAVAAGRSRRDRWYAVRDRLLASPRFQRWAAAFAFTRPIAQRRARALFDLCAGFVYSQVLAACVRLRLCEILLEGPQTREALAPRLGLSADATSRLLDAAVALRLAAKRRGDRYGVGDLGAALAGNPGIAAMVEHHAALYGDLRDPVALLRGEERDTELARYWPYAGSSAPATLPPERIAAYTALMSASQSLVAGEVLDAYPFAHHRCLLDVGGGDGTFLAAVAPRAPALRLVLFELPAVAERARARFAAAGLADRATAVGGDFFADGLPAGADVAALVRVLHDHDDAGAIALLRAVRRALPEDGVVLIAEPMAGTRGAEPVGAAYFGFYLLAMGRGRPRTPGEIADLLRRTGFERVCMVPTRRPLQTGLIVAHAARR
jgi:demethylspheroidene O-methyltransferase